MKQRLISLDKLKEYPIRLDHYDKENGSKQFVYGVESVLEYADYLPIIEAIPIEWIEKQIKTVCDNIEAETFGKWLIKEWEKENE